MTHQKENPHPSQDPYLQSAFNAQELPVPSHMDRFIVSAAAKAVHKPQIVSSNAKFTALQRIRPVLATAAVVLIGIGTLPMLFDSPESTISYTIDLSDRHTQTAEIDSQSDKLTVASRATETPKPAKSTLDQAELTSVRQDIIAQASQPTPGNNEIALNSNKIINDDNKTMSFDTQILSESINAASVASLSNQTSQSFSLTPEFAYRQTPKRWITHIEKLVDTKKLDEAKEEFQLFHSAFPDIASLQLDLLRIFEKLSTD